MEATASASVDAEAASLLPASASPARAPRSPGAADLLRRQQQLQAMEVFNFDGFDFVRLRLLGGCGRARYLHAAEDGRSVRLDPRRDSHNAVWAVTPYFYGGMAIRCVLLRGAYGRYLAAPDATALGCLGLPSSSSRCRPASQRDYDMPEVPAILWRAVATRRRGAFLLQNATERYLRANSRCLLPCCSGLHLSARAGLCMATRWAVERVPRASGRPELPIPTQSLFARLCPPLSGLCMSEREIRWVRANGQGGVCSQDEWPSEQFAGRLTAHLKTQLVNLLSRRFYFPDYTLCVRAGRYGQLSPLVVNLPRSRERLDIVILERNTAAESELIYPDVHAVAGAAAAVEEPVR